jgi:hypothetical protein
MGHEDAFPRAKAERPLSVQSRDLRGDAGQRARRAVSGHSVVRRKGGLPFTSKMDGRESAPP